MSFLHLAVQLIYVHGLSRGRIITCWESAHILSSSLLPSRRSWRAGIPVSVKQKRCISESYVVSSGPPVTSAVLPRLCFTPGVHPEPSPSTAPSSSFSSPHFSRPSDTHTRDSHCLQTSFSVILRKICNRTVDLLKPSSFLAAFSGLRPCCPALLSPPCLSLAFTTEWSAEAVLED